MDLTESTKLINLLKASEYWKNVQAMPSQWDSRYTLKPKGHISFPWTKDYICPFCACTHPKIKHLNIGYWEKPHSRGFFCEGTFHSLGSQKVCLL